MKKYLIIICTILLTNTAKTQTCTDLPASAPDSRFAVNGNEVTDTDTGLIWQRCTLGQTGSDCSGGSADRYTWQRALQAASAPWRLPSSNELRSIVEKQCSKPAINLTVFPNTVSSHYWSASPHADSSYGAWAVYFYDGGSDHYYKDYYGHVRLVRGGQ